MGHYAWPLIVFVQVVFEQDSTVNILASFSLLCMGPQQRRISSQILGSLLLMFQKNSLCAKGTEISWRLRGKGVSGTKTF